jgi:YggT family protein
MSVVLITIVQRVFLCYTILLMVRIIGSWFPSVARHRLMRFVAFYVDPYLNLFRRWIPPTKLGIDFSPILAFFGLQIAEKIVVQILIWIFF